MSSLKIKGRQKARHPPTPYERTKRLVSKVRDWLTPVLWGAPKAREEGEELDRESEEIDTGITEQSQQQGGSSSVQQNCSDGNNSVSGELNQLADRDKGDDNSFVKEASDDEDLTSVGDQSTRVHQQHVGTSVRTMGGAGDSSRLDTVAETSALQLDGKVNQPLPISRTPVGSKGLPNTHTREVLHNYWNTTSQLGLVNNDEEYNPRSSKPQNDPVADSGPSATTSSFPPPQSLERLFSQPSVSTPGKTDTEESIKNSPFQSPFYRGKTSYGGASSLMQPRTKRLKTDLASSLSSQVVHYTVKARVSSEQQPVASQTAKKILQTLETLSTPLSDARKVPLRTTPLGTGQAAKRVKHDHLGTLSSPPTTPLVIPSRQQGPVIVPSLDRGKGQPALSVAMPPLKGANGGSPSRQATLNKPDASLLSQPLASGTVALSSHTVTTSIPMATLAAIRFPSTLNSSPERANLLAAGSALTSLPVASSLPDLSFGRAAQMVSSSSSDSVLGGSGAPGKVKTHSRQHYSAPRDQPDDFVNTMEPPPPVPLKIGPQGSLPKFSFASSLVSGATGVPANSVSEATRLGSAFSKPFSLPTCPLKPLPSAAIPPVTASSIAVSSAGQFAFSAPKELIATSGPHLPQIPTKSPMFTFSAPKSRQTSTTTQSPFSRMSLPAAAKPPEVGMKTPLPLLTNISVLDALKKQEFQPLGKGPTFSATKKECVIDLTDDDNKDEVIKHKPAASNVSLLGGKVAELRNTPDSLKPEMLVQNSASKQGPSVSSSQPVTVLGTGGLKIGGLSGLPVSNSSSSQPSIPLGGGLGLNGLPVSNSQPSIPLGGGLKIGGLSGLPVSNSSSSQPSIPLGGGLKIGGLSGLPVSNSSSSQPSIPLGGGLKIGGLSGLPVSNSSSSQPSIPLGGGLGLSGLPVSSSQPSISLGGELKIGGLSGLPVSSSQPSTSLSGGLKIGGLSGLTLPTTTSARQEKSEMPAPTVSNVVPKLSPLSGQLVMPPPPLGSWECSTCMVQNKPEAGSCVACGTGKHTGNASGSLNVVQAKPLTAVVSSASWECQTCLLMNKADDLKCVACTSSKPGAGSSSGGNPFQHKPQSTLPVVFGEGGGIKLSLGGGLKIAGITSLSSGANKIDGHPEKQEGQSISSAVSLSLDKSDGGLKLGFTGTLPSFPTGGLQLGLSNTGKDMAKTAEAPPQPTFSLGTASFGIGVGAAASSDKKEDTEPSKALFGGPLTGAATAAGGIKFAVPPAASLDNPKSSTASSVAAPQSALTFSLNTLGNSALCPQGVSEDAAAGGSSQKPFQHPGIGILPSFQGSSLSSATASTSSEQHRPLLTGISFAVQTSSGASTEPTTSAVKLSAPPSQSSASPSVGLFSAQPPQSLMFAGSFPNAALSQASVTSLAATVAPSANTVQQPSLSLFGGASNSSSLQPSSLKFTGSPFPAQSSKPTVPMFAAPPNPFTSQSSVPSFASAASSSSIFNSATTTGNVSFNFSAGKSLASAAAGSSSQFGTGVNPSVGVAIPTFQFGSGTNEASFNFSAGLRPAAPVNFSVVAPTSDKSSIFSASLDASAKTTTLFPKMAVDVNPQMNTSMGFGTPPTLQQTQHGGNLSLPTPNFAFSGGMAGQQQQLPSSNLAASAGIFGGGGGGSLTITGRQPGALLFGGGGASSIGGTSQFAAAPFMAGQAAAANLSGGSTNGMLGSDALFTPGASGGGRVIKKAVRKKAQ